MKCIFVYTPKCNDNQLLMRESAECRQKSIFQITVGKTRTCTHTMRSKSISKILYVCKNENTLDLV